MEIEPAFETPYFSKKLDFVS